MSHEIYTTKGFVISSVSKGEADKIFDIFTEDLGLVFASAQGVRKIESKLRYSLQDFSFSQVSFIATKIGWRIVSASPIESSEKIAKSEVKVKTLRLIKRLMGQDESNTNLFGEIVSAFKFIDVNKDSNMKSIEALLVLKTLSSLGYWGEEKEDDFAASPFNVEVIEKISQKRKNIVKELNKSLRATHLM